MISEKILLDVDGVEYEGKLAKVDSTSLGYEGHGIPTAFLNCSGDGWGQGAGGYHLGAAGMSAFVMGVLDCLKLDTWEKVAGQQVMLLYKPGASYPVEGIKPAVGGKPFLFKPAMEAVNVA